MGKAAFNKKKALFFHQQTGLKFREENSEVVHWKPSCVWY